MPEVFSPICIKGTPTKEKLRKLGIQHEYAMMVPGDRRDALPNPDLLVMGTARYEAVVIEGSEVFFPQAGLTGAYLFMLTESVKTIQPSLSTKRRVEWAQ